MKREALLQGILHISHKHLSGFPVKETSLKVPFMESLAEGYPSTRALLHSSIKVPCIRGPHHIPGSLQMERGHNGERCPHPETFLTYLPGSLVKELPLRSPPRSLFRESRFIHRAPFIRLKAPVDEPSSRFPKRGPSGKRCPSPEPFLPIYQGPQQGNPPFRFPSQSSHRNRHPSSRAPFNRFSKSPVDEPTPGCPTEPHK